MSDVTLRKGMGTDFTDGPIMPLLLKFFLPFLLANMLNSIYNTVDTIIIGHLVGSEGLVAVNMGGKMLNLFTGVGLAFSGGGQVLISQLAGAKRQEEYNATIGTMFTEMFSLSIIFSIVTLLFSEKILLLLNTPAESFAAALSYLRITSAGLPLIFGYNAVSSVLRGMGDSRSPLIFIAIAAVFNLIGDIVFIVCFGMGVPGTAVATVMGQGISLIFSVIVLYKKRERFGFDFRWRSFAVDWRKLWVMLRLGLPMALRTGFITATQLVMMGFINLYGLTEAAAYAVGDKLVHLANIFAISARQAAGGMIGQNAGAGRLDRVKSIVRCTMAVTLASAVLMSAVSLAFPEYVFGLFSTEAPVLAYARTFMRIACIIFILSGIMDPFEALLTGVGNAALSFIGGLLDGVIFRVCFSLLFARALGMGVTGFFLGDALARLGPLIVSGSYYLSGVWKKRKKLIDN